ncbi:glycerol-3-phosphate dehydrogenase (NAD(P)+) [Deferribacter desulfuricans SSM1]|uniref:Glycerol-3-phosphate dehydrogenase [NAD(P)+] n=1 Tax=Deferribacter desulfuricans (strain DSM 14783 / JCM 11476 / NBRC 101012 / SSM1) TaxID=639282 RepID=D3P9N0_DEFDS|nr:NAD(P)H-dependent glycerol-3-phosphate dehydrogenase [Deferribacter desulfuricans]BAI81420.1 glycerol-3-phosphate dehydrogenase (NAD(P)+) [Deferribacter desulfuricans SSM1]
MQEVIAVIGGGSWGTALANLLTDNGHKVTLYVREYEVVESINKNSENSVFLKGIKLNDSLNCKQFDDFDGNCDKIVWVVPTQFTRDTIVKFGEKLIKKNIIVATKGIEIEYKKFVNEIFEEILGIDVSVISGPSFAKEVAKRMPTAVSIASKDINKAIEWQKIFSNKYFRCYAVDDVIGVEVCGSLKNVIAIATGISDGLGFGHNARAGIITRGLREITRLGLKVGGKLETFMGLSGVGDLVLTCTGDLSRNRTVGIKIGIGEKAEDILKDMKMVAEGVFTTKAVYELSKDIDVEMPITEEVYKIIYEGKEPIKSFYDIMERPLKVENI